MLRSAASDGHPGGGDGEAALVSLRVWGMLALLRSGVDDGGSANEGPRGWEGVSELMASRGQHLAWRYAGSWMVTSSVEVMKVLLLL